MTAALSDFIQFCILIVTFVGLCSQIFKRKESRHYCNSDGFPHTCYSRSSYRFSAFRQLIRRNHPST